MRAFCALWLLLGATGVQAAEVLSYQVRLGAAADGSAAVSAVLRLEQVDAGDFSVPLGFAGVTELVLRQAPQGTAIDAEPLDSQTLLRIRVPEAAPPAFELGFEFRTASVFLPTAPAPGERSTLPAGSRVLRHALVNSQPAPIRGYRVEATFPDELRVHAIREALPRQRRTETALRVQLGAIDGRSGARLQVDRLLPGESAAMQLELVPRSRSLGWLLVGAGLAIAYLVYFKDIVGGRAG